MNKLFIVFFVFLIEIVLVGTVYATSITKEFYIEIDSIISSDPDHPYEGSSSAIMSAGDRFYGSVSYDNTNIPNQGSWIIRHSYLNDWEPSLPLVPGTNEYQYWNVESNDPYLYEILYGTIMGWSTAWIPPALIFEDSKLIGMDFLYDPDYDYIHNDMMRIQGVNFTDRGYYYTYSDNGYVMYGDASISGTLHFIPEPTTILLLGSGLAGLVGFRKKFKK